MSASRLSWTALILVLAASSCRPALAATNDPSSPIRIDVDGDRVTVEVAAAPLIDAMTLLARAAGVTLDWRGRGDVPVSARFQDEPLVDAVARLVKPRSHLIVYERRAGVERAQRIVVMAAPGEADAAPVHLARFENPAPADSPEEGGLNPAVEAMLADPEPAVRAQMLTHAAALEPDDPRRETVVTRLTGDPDAAVRRAALRARRELDKALAARDR